MPLTAVVNAPPDSAVPIRSPDPARAGRAIGIPRAKDEAVPARAGASASAGAVLGAQDLAEIATRLNRQLNGAASIEFSIDEATQRVVARVIDRQTKEVIRQFPSEAVLAIAAALDRIVPGVLLADEA